MLIEAFPLCWPDGWKRTLPHEREGSRYRVKFTEARDELIAELKLLGAKDFIISTDIQLRRDGIPYANHREPNDPGVAVYWTDERGQPRVLACDQWATVRENLRAIGVTVASLRSIARARAGEILNRAYEGFARLPEHGFMDWKTVLGFERVRFVSLEDLNRRYRELSKERHPDSGGSNQAMVQLNQAYELAKREILS